MSEGKQPKRDRDCSDSGYGMELISQPRADEGVDDPSQFGSPHRPTTAPINITGRHDTRQSTSSLPRSASALVPPSPFSPPQSSPFSPPKFGNLTTTEFNSDYVIAGIAFGEDNTGLVDHHCSEDYLSGDPQFQETGRLQPSAMSLPTTGVSVHGDKHTTTGATSLGAVGTDKAKRICFAVSEYYKKQFVHQWREKTRGRTQGSNTMSVIAALLIEQEGDFNVVLLTAGTKIKQECTFVRGNIGESTWGLCDGHAEAVCYRLASLYFLTEIYKTHKRRESIFEFIEGKGYKLKNGIEFHLFTSHPPCGFMAKKERYYLSWKRPFKTTPHNPQCSSKILINSYLGIQGPLSHILVQPIYLSSLVILRYETVPTLHDNYIEKRLQAFWEKLSAVPALSASTYYFCKPDVFVVDIHPLDLFPTCFTPYTHEKCTKPPCDGELPHQESTVKQTTKQHTNQIGGAFPDALGNAGIETLVFSINEGIGSKADREKMIKLKGKLFRPPPDLKKQRLKSLQDARIRLSKAINVSEALKIQDDQIVEQMKSDYVKRCDIVDETISALSSLKLQKTDINDLTVQMNEFKETSLGKSKENALHSLLTNNLNNEKMHQDLKKLEDSTALNQNVYLDVMGCDWARYMETMENEF